MSERDLEPSNGHAVVRDEHDRGDANDRAEKDDQTQCAPGRRPPDGDQHDDKLREDKQREDKPNDDNSDNDKSDDKKKKDDKPKGPPFYKRPILMTVLIAVVLVLGITALLFYLHARQYASTDDAFIDGNVVAVSPNVSATILQVLVNDNWVVKKGELIVQLDPRDFQAVLDQKVALLESARGKLDESLAQVQVDQADLDEASAGVEVAEANAANAMSDYKRIGSLDEKARSQQQLDTVTANQKSTYAQVDQAKAKVEAAQAQVLDAQRNVKTAQDQVASAQADVAQAQLNLGYCNIIAPQDGMITRKSVQPGAYVQTGQALLSLVPTDVWVTANYKESQLDLIRIGQSVTIHVDAYPEKDLLGKVDSIQNGSGAQFSLLPPENATGNYVKVVQRIPIKILFLEGQLDGYPHLLMPGLSVEPYIHVQE